MSHPIIIANIVGGLGNQMFQYANARALAVEFGMPLKVTQDMFGVYTSHYGPELERVFSLTLDITPSSELKKMIGVLRVSPIVRRLLASNMFSLLRDKHFIVEPHYHYWDGLRDQARTGGYLQGYWQSERYFSNHLATIRSDFIFRQPATGYAAELASVILSTASVSVHVRRGDYVNNAKALSFHGICSPEYYFNAIEILLKRVPRARFFAFSDDPKWVSDVLLPRYPDLTLVDQNKGENSYNDMRLMSLCQHHIIANSSFSWWGAWLNANPDKIVIAPARWFANGGSVADLIPEKWELL
jgi:Glycosyl transferase family 11